MPEVLLDRPGVLPVVQLRLQIREARHEIQPEPVQAKSALLDRCQTATKEKPPELLKKIFPVAWQHVHFLGHYLFRDYPTQSTWKPF
jgi:hypothetical protein